MINYLILADWKNTDRQAEAEVEAEAEEEVEAEAEKGRGSGSASFYDCLFMINKNLISDYWINYIRDF